MLRANVARVTILQRMNISQPRNRLAQRFGEREGRGWEGGGSRRIMPPAHVHAFKSDEQRFIVEEMAKVPSPQFRNSVAATDENRHSR